MEPIISRDMIAAKARAAFAQGAGRDDHGFNWHSTAAIDAWQGEWDRCAAGRSRQAGNHITDVTNMVGQQLAGACPP
jgi:hypothetical protein